MFEEEDGRGELMEGYPVKRQEWSWASVSVPGERLRLHFSG